MYTSAEQIYRKLLKAGILEADGRIIVDFLGVQAVVNEKSAMGDLIQEWLGQWMLKNGINYRVKANSQEFPDFLLDKSSDEKNLLEVKTFDIEAGPNFDVANFEAYVRSLLNHSYRLNAKYLIFGYKLENHNLTIKKMRLKNVREICCASKNYAIRIQKKQGMIYNIRPANWESKRSKFKVFGNRMEFLQAIQSTLNAYSKTKHTHSARLDEVLKDYSDRGLSL